ncbi:MAG TPA: hypothetical protein VGJ96_04080 [Gemmatimonadaceae bacterium]
MLIVVLHTAGRAAIATHTGLEERLLDDIEASQAERLCAAALAVPDRHAAYRVLDHALGQFASPVPGLRNAGLFAMHELERGVPVRGDWAAACQSASALLPTSGRALIEGLGYRIEQLPGPAAVLVGGARHVAIAIFLERPDQIEPVSESFGQLSPISYALAKADEKNLDYVIVAAGRSLRVYPVKPGVGTGRRGRTETFIEFDLTMLREAQAGYLALLASAAALADGGSFSQILATSREFAVALGERLRDRVYADVLPGLAEAMVVARRFRNPSPEKLAETYEMALLVLFRLLFVAYAEDKELLPLHSNQSYRQHSLKEIALRLVRELAENAAYGREDFYWTEISQLWRAVDRGNRSWGVPAYNGGLFATDSSPAAARLSEISLPDEAFVPALRALLLDEADEKGLAPIDFRSLGVREFGTIYEGLLEQELAVAERDLGVDRQTGAYVPTARGVPVVVSEGRVYLHNASGARKASGAYYTKDFAVEHLLEHALDPALDDHLARLSASLDDREKAEHFFDFHVADIAMGSGHFLVAAIDHIERKLSGFLANHALPGVRSELERLRLAAREALGQEYRGDAIEDTQLLRRQIARRCIFGVDLNPLAVELARLSIWIHTFVPGLPLSFLDQNLVAGNSLVGIATFDEAQALLGGGEDLFSLSAEELLAGSREPLERLGRLSDATVAEVKEAKALYAKARLAIRPTAELFTILAAARIDTPQPGDTAKQREARLSGAVGSGLLQSLRARQRDVFIERACKRADNVLDGLAPLHFPVAFPSVFVGGRAGFDVILGNPPWEKARVEELEFWGRHFPGVRALGTADRNRKLRDIRESRPDLVEKLEREKRSSETFREAVRWMPGMNTGHPDLFRAFLARFLQLTSLRDGRMGIVLPGEAFKVRGALSVRELLISRSSSLSIQLATNRAEWLFEGVDGRKLVAFVSAKMGREQGVDSWVSIAPEVHSRRVFESTGSSEASSVRAEWLRRYSDGLVVPILPAKRSIQTLEKLMKHERLRDHADLPIVRVYADFETTRDSDRWHSEKRYGDWPVFKGESFDIWTPDTGLYYGYTEGKSIRLASFERVQRANANSPYASLSRERRGDEKRLAVLRPRIAFRDVTNRTNSRTLVVALIPPKVVTTQSAPWILWKTDEPRPADEALLLGFMSSIPTDWWMRRFAEGHVDQEAFGSIPVPRTEANRRAADTSRRVAARLATVDGRYEEWGAHFGIAPSVPSPDERQDLLAELDAAVSIMYGLDEGDVRHIFETFHEGWDFEERLNAVLAHFRRLRQKA